jgi:branched-chain amino acid transport system permease protein
VSIWLNQVVQGVLLGGYYAILASGLALLFGVMRIINLAHGDLAVLGAFLVLVCTDHGIDAFVALAIVLPAMALFGWALQRTILERSLRAGALIPLLSTFGLAIVIQNLLFEKFGADERSLGPSIGTLSYSSWTITNEIYIGKLSVLIFVVAVAVLLGLQLFLARTSLGRAMRATAEDPDTAELVGVNSRAVYALAAALALAMAGLAGAFLGMRSTFDPYSGSSQLIFAFEAVVIGGMTLWGTLVGAIVLGVAQTVGSQMAGEGWIKDVWGGAGAGDIVFLVVLAARLVLAALDERGGLRTVLGQRT